MEKASVEEMIVKEWKWICPLCGRENYEENYRYLDNPSILMCSGCFEDIEVYFGDL